MLLAGVDAAAEQVRKSNPDLGYGASFADALVVMAESFLANGPAARSSGDGYQVVLSIDGDVLAFDTDGECALDNGPALAPETVRRLSCDASAVLMVRGPSGEVLDVGRKTRTIPPAIKRALRTRDTTCRWPGCDEARYLAGHHGVHWSHLGPTKLTNLVHLCWHHHFLVHEGGWTLEIRPDGWLDILDPNGGVLGAPATHVIGDDEPALTDRNRSAWGDHRRDRPASHAGTATRSISTTSSRACCSCTIPASQAANSPPHADPVKLHSRRRTIETLRDGLVHGGTDAVTASRRSPKTSRLP